MVFVCICQIWSISPFSEQTFDKHWNHMKSPPSSIRSLKIDNKHSFYHCHTHGWGVSHVEARCSSPRRHILKNSGEHHIHLQRSIKRCQKPLKKDAWSHEISFWGQRPVFREIWWNMLVSRRVYKFRIEFSCVNINISSVGATARFSSETVSCLNSFLGLPTMCWKNLNVQLDNQKSSLWSCLLSWW